MSNSNSSKQVLLSILGIAILVIAVVGVSFAFFNYSSTGENQQLTTGEIFFQFTDGEAITLTDQFPMTDTEAESLTTDESQVIEFSILGNNSAGTEIPFVIEVVEGDPIDSKTRFNDNDIKLKLTETTTDGDPSLTNNIYSSAKKVSEDANNTAIEAGVKLAEGNITSTTRKTCTFELRMWISGDVTFGQSDDGKGSYTYTNDEFGKKFYSIKVRVKAGDAVDAA